jgi:hypothetical protein
MCSPMLRYNSTSCRLTVLYALYLSELYGVETRVLNQAVKRNGKRFPEDFMFALTGEEIMNLSQIVISSKIKHACLTS